MINFSIYFLFLLGMGVGLIVLQVFLSKKENKWAGLVLPALAFFISLIYTLSMAAYTTAGSTRIQKVMEDGVVMEERVMMEHDTASLVAAVLYTFLLTNIPTTVLLAIYVACRGSRRKRRALEKMSVQDLE